MTVSPPVAYAGERVAFLNLLWQAHYLGVDSKGKPTVRLEGYLTSEDIRKLSEIADWLDEQERKFNSVD